MLSGVRYGSACLLGRTARAAAGPMPNFLRVLPVAATVMGAAVLESSTAVAALVAALVGLAAGGLVGCAVATLVGCAVATLEVSGGGASVVGTAVLGAVGAVVNSVSVMWSGSADVCAPPRLLRREPQQQPAQATTNFRETRAPPA